jgi:membrane fusion protein, multidrug efflux system
MENTLLQMFKLASSSIFFSLCISSWVNAAEPVAAQCLFEPSMTVELGSPVRGVLSGVLVDRGDLIKKGETVARIDSRAQRAAVALAKSRAEFAQRTIERNEELIEDDLLSSQEMDEMATESQLALLELDQAETNLDMRNIKSPINGVVVKIVHTEGEFIDDTEILVLAQIDPINVEVVVPVNSFGQITEGMQATVTPEAPLEGTYQATVVVVDKVIDAASGTFRVRLTIPNKDLKIPTGLRCDLEFPFEV